ncbi:MAG: hypothetical protein CFE30_05870 [Bradyrhizobium sp. PARBB1]|nr:MAG: hypothetical protein CFE30_05870 [Bradyrhizobium sp. PARBB1]
MAKLLVAGGLYEKDETGPLRRRFAEALGRQTILRGHTLLGGCRTQLALVVAQAASAAAQSRKLDPNKMIHSWVTRSTTPIHKFGEITRSQLGDWSEVPRGFAFPEPVRECDAMIIIGGWDGTQHAASWGRFANKPILSVATFGGAATDIYVDELASFERRGVSNLSREDYQALNRFMTDENDEVVDQYAAEVVTLAERAILSTEVFVVMSFENVPHLTDAYATFGRVCKEKGFSAVKVDDHLDSNERIVPAIFAGIRRAAFVIAEVSGARPNVFYELGYARASGKAVIQTAYSGTKLPFDVFDVPTLFWGGQSELEGKLKTAIDQFMAKPGRFI